MHGVGCSEADCKKMFVEADTKKDGVLQSEEYTAWVFSVDVQEKLGAFEGSALDPVRLMRAMVGEAAAVVASMLAGQDWEIQVAGNTTSKAIARLRPVNAAGDRATLSSGTQAFTWTPWLLEKTANIMAIDRSNRTAAHECAEFCSEAQTITWRPWLLEKTAKTAPQLDRLLTEKRAKCPKDHALEEFVVTQGSLYESRYRACGYACSLCTRRCESEAMLGCARCGFSVCMLCHDNGPGKLTSRSEDLDKKTTTPTGRPRPRPGGRPKAQQTSAKGRLVCGPEGRGCDIGPISLMRKTIREATELVTSLLACHDFKVTHMGGRTSTVKASKRTSVSEVASRSLPPGFDRTSYIHPEDVHQCATFCCEMLTFTWEPWLLETTAKTASQLDELLIEQEARCPSGHTLRESQAEGNLYFTRCNLCKEANHHGTFLGCSQCNLYVCTRCHEEGLRQPTPDGKLKYLAETTSSGLLRHMPLETAELAWTSLEKRKHLRQNCEVETADPKLPGEALSDHIAKLLEQGLAADMTLKYGSEEIPCHRAILWARVPDLRQALESLPQGRDEALGVEPPTSSSLSETLEYIYRGTGGSYGGNRGDFCGVKRGVSALRSDLRDLFYMPPSNVGEFCLVCGGEGDSVWEIPVHSAILQMRSKYFRQLLSGDWLEVGVVKVQVDQSLGISNSTMCMILEFLYTNELPQLQIDEYFDCWSIVEYYDLPDLELIMENRLGKAVDFSTCIDLLTWAQQNSVDHVERTAFRFLRQKFDAIASSHQQILTRVPRTTLLELLREDALQVDEETVVLNAILRWAIAPTSDEEPPRRDFLSELFPWVRLSLIPPGPERDFSPALPDPDLHALFLETCPEKLLAAAALVWEGSALQHEALSQSPRPGHLFPGLPRLTEKNLNLLAEVRDDKAKQSQKAKWSRKCHDFRVGRYDDSGNGSDSGSGSGSDSSGWSDSS